MSRSTPAAPARGVSLAGPDAPAGGPHSAFPGRSFPPLLPGAALVFWGWQVGVLPVAALMALVIEGARRMPWRWDFSDRDFNRVADVSGVVLLLVVLYAFDTYTFEGIYAILRWLPFVLFIPLLAQAYSTRESLNVSALFLSLRRAEARGRIASAGRLDFTGPYFVVCLVSASAGSRAAGAYYAGVCVLVGWLLWRWRPRHHPAPAFALLAALAAGGGLAGQQVLLGARAAVEPLVFRWIQDRLWRFRDPYSAHTAIGAIGRLKTSERIVLRVRPDRPLDSPLLLREASYRSFLDNVWLAGHASFAEILPEGGGEVWNLSEDGARARRSVEISQYLVRNKALLALPTGSVRVGGLLVEEMKRNPLGAVEVFRGPALLQYRVRYDPERSFDAPPGAEDRAVPGKYERMLAHLVAGLGLRTLAPREAMRRLDAWFLHDFRYTLVQRRRIYSTPLSYFLLHSRAGHCEYFATAAALLLRAAGIPTRYATGWSVQEYSPLEHQYVVRERHAHAWVLAYVDGRWLDFDPTPPVWGALEESSEQWWTPLYDFWSWVGYLFNEWRFGRSGEGSHQWLVWLTVPLFAVLVLRLRKRRRVRRGGAGTGTPPAAPRGPGRDSGMYRIERSLQSRGLRRPPGEPLSHWLIRLDRAGEIPEPERLLGEILPLHYRFRFDPAGLSPSQRGTLREHVQVWLARHARES